MQPYISPIEFHTRMTDLASDLMNAGHDFHAGALAYLALNFQQENNVEVAGTDVTHAAG